MINHLLTIAILAFLSAVSLSTLSAQVKENNKVVIIEKEIDEDGKVTETKIVKQGAEAEAYLEKMKSQEENTWVTDEGAEMDSSDKKIKMTRKEAYEIKVEDGAGKVKVLKWNGEGEMPEEMKSIMEKEGMGDFALEEKHSQIKIKRRGGTDEEKVLELEFDGEELPADVKELLEKEGIDLEEFTHTDGTKELRVTTKGDGEAKSKTKKVKIMKWEGEGEMPDDMKSLLEKEGLTDRVANGKKQSRVIIKKKEGAGKEEVMELEFDGDELPTELKDLLKNEGIEVEEFTNADGSKDLRVITKAEIDGAPKAKKAQLGIGIDMHKQGVIVTRVQTESAAAEAGLNAGDIITAIDGETMGEPSVLIGKVGEYLPGDKIQVAFLREGKAMTKEVVLKEKVDLFPFKTWEQVMDKAQNEKQIEIEIEHKLTKEKK